MTLQMIRSMKFTTKLFIAVTVLCMASILIVAGNAIVMSQQGLLTLGRDAVEHLNEAVFNSLRSYDETISRKLDSDLKVFEREVLAQGKISVDSTSTQQRTIVNQASKQSEQVDLPKFLVDTTPLAGNEDLVDSITAQTGSVATIFQLVGDKLLRVATTVKNQQGERAVGTYIPADSPVFKTISQGQVYKGKAFVVNDWYLTAYMPLRGAKGEIVGALFVGQLMLAPEVRTFITTTKLNSGYFFAYTEAGDMVVHPSLGKETNLFTLLPVFKEHKKGFLDYTYEGEKKVAYVQPIDKWGLNLAFTISHAGIDDGLTATMVWKNILVGGAMIVMALLLCCWCGPSTVRSRPWLTKASR